MATSLSPVNEHIILLPAIHSLNYLSSYYYYYYYYY